MAGAKQTIKKLFGLCRKTIVAMGDETRQSILLALLDGPWEGMRVGEITAMSHLSQPAVSHHLKILCDAGLLSMRKEGAMNYYYLNPDRKEINHLLELFQAIADTMDN